MYESTSESTYCTRTYYLFVPFEDMKINTSYKYESTTTIRIVGPTVHVHKVCAAKYLHSFVLSYFVRSGAEVSYNFISGSTSGSTRTVS